MIKIKPQIHYETNFKKIIIIVLIIVITISAIATTTLYIKENRRDKLEITIEPEKEINIFDNLPSEPLSLPPE